MRNKIYSLLYCIAWPFFNLVHPVKAIGRAHIPAGGCLVCANHTSLADPLLAVFAFHLEHQVFPMAKAELFRVPVVGWLLMKAGVFGVQRGKSDVGAIKQAMKYLKNGQKVMIFPEGTRIHEGEEGEAKTGAAMLALRTAVPIVPVFIPPKKRLFRHTAVVIGEAYTPQTAEKKATAEEYRAIADDLMQRIRALEAQAQ